MSHDVTKTAIRLVMPEWDGFTWHQAHEKASVLGEMYKDEDEGEIEYFWHDDYQFVKNGTRFAVDMLLAPVQDSCEHPGLYMSLEELRSKASELAAHFGKSADDCVVVCVTWYNGVDEPVEF